MILTSPTAAFLFLISIFALLSPFISILKTPLKVLLFPSGLVISPRCVLVQFTVLIISIFAMFPSGKYEYMSLSVITTISFRPSHSYFTKSFFGSPKVAIS
nr:MAG TPA: hypothetical protein [Caudoviricetes sp.]